MVFDDLIPNMEVDKKLNCTATEMFLWGRKINISLVLIS